MKLKYLIHVLFCGAFNVIVNAQTGMQGGKIQVINANTFEVMNKGKGEVRKLVGDVRLKQENTLLYCDSAYLFPEINYVEAYRNVRINHNDSVDFFGDILRYDGKTRVARLEKNVSMVDPHSTLTSNELDFDLSQNKASYYNGGKLVNGSNTLTSRTGYYYTRTKELYFKKDVRLLAEDFTMTSDTLRYNTVTKVATFYGRTVIVSEEDTVYCHAGTYNTQKQSGVLWKRPVIRSAENTLVADTIYYDRKNRYSRSLKNIVIEDTLNKTIVLGNMAELFGEQQTSYVTDGATALTIMDKDTLLIWADTIYTYRKSARNTGDLLKAYYKVNIFKSDLQAVCDSMVYTRKDSVMTMYKQPVLWSENNQITGDTILFYINNRKLDSMDVIGNAFVASRVNAQHYNQIKGRNLKAYFKEGRIDYIQVYGNGQSIYYAEEDSAYLGVNVINCSEMKFTFTQGKIKNAYFITQPEATFYPLNELKPEELKLKGFKWMAGRKPKRRKLEILKI